MKVPLKWLAEFVDIGDLSPRQIAERLILSGTEVESITRVGELADDYIVVQVLDIIRKEGIRLPICVIYDGNSKYEVLTGAENIKKGKYLWCPPGKRVKKGNDIVQIGIKRVKDIQSYGMLLSPSEIGLPGGEETKLLELPEYVETGKKASEILGLPDDVLDLSVTPQRGDLLSIVGVAIEASAITGRKIKFDADVLWSLEHAVQSFGEILTASSKLVEITIEEPRKCKLYLGGIFYGAVKNEISNPLVISRLYMCGSRPINPIVDITNYILFEIGQPTHAFDFEKIPETKERKRRIIIRNSKRGEKILCLDGKERELSDDDLVIADRFSPIALAGVIGGESTAVSLSTKKVFIESAYFVPQYIRRTSKHLGVETESSYRFSRGVNPAGVIVAVGRIKELLEREGFELVELILTGEKDHFQNRIIEVPISFFSEYVGLALSYDEIRSSLNRLGIKISGDKDKNICIIPIWRGDISLKEDLVEEVIRIVGYDKIPSTLPKFPSSYDEKQEEIELRDFIDRTRKIMHSLGYCEVKTYPFSKNEGIAIVNPISSELLYFSDKLEERIYETIVESYKKGMKNIRIFEIEKDFSENWMLSFGICGYSFPQKWAFPKDKKSDFFDIKEVFELILTTEFSVTDEKIEENSFSCAIVAKDRKIGEAIIRYLPEISDTIFLGKLYLNPVFELQRDIPVPQKSLGRFYSELPLIERDISFFIKENTRWRDIKKFFFSSEKVVDAFVLDVWEREGKRSLTVRLIINQGDKTMNSNEINQILQDIIANLTNLGLEVRSS